MNQAEADMFLSWKVIDSLAWEAIYDVGPYLRLLTVTAADGSWCCITVEPDGVPFTEDAKATYRAEMQKALNGKQRIKDMCGRLVALGAKIEYFAMPAFRPKTYDPT